ncbi:MAG TPA: amidohydrolase family protein, partial [Cyclobacteriaceae bacterium]|nr:amidohydrolase family protein [Cyclobacteriaceae bacterium]
MMHKILSLICLLSLVLAAQAQRTLIHCGNLIDVKNGNTRTQVTIVVEGNQIKVIENGFTKAVRNDLVIDLSKKTVMPGLIDMHVHIEGETNKDQALQR